MSPLLWIAFIFQYLWDTTQRSNFRRWRLHRCELLSFFSIFGIQHNFRQIGSIAPAVVNCFHFSVSLGYNTTFYVNNHLPQMLWIAFIFQYLWDTTQHRDLTSLLKVGCELLSFFSIFGIQHNICIRKVFCNHVVNCFHFSVSLGYNTTFVFTLYDIPPLWIAFIFQYLWDTTQHNAYHAGLLLGCELLSFFSIFGIQHNNGNDNCVVTIVVNCFHFSVSLGYNTTFLLFSTCIVLLWIAFIFQYLWDTTQPNSSGAVNLNSCELLSFFSIFGIQHNFLAWCRYSVFVVNCFHFSVSLGYNTTAWFQDSGDYALWIAFIFQYLWDTTQPCHQTNSMASGCELLSFFSIFGIQHNTRSI